MACYLNWYQHIHRWSTKQIAKVASKAALDEIVSELVAHKKNHTGQRVRDNHFSVAHQTLNDVGVDISKDVLKQRVSRAIHVQSSAKTITEVNIVNSPSSAVSSITAPTPANTDELEVPPLTPPRRRSLRFWWSSKKEWCWTTKRNHPSKEEKQGWLI